MASSERIKDIDSQINLLQGRKKRLEEKRKTQLSTIITRCGANEVPDDVLAGAILDIVRAFSNNDNRLGNWRSEGQKVLKPGRGKKKFTAKN